MGLVDDLCLIFVAAVIGGLIARAARMPLVLGYIFAGLLVSPHTPGPRVGEVHDVEHLAEIGVALLMFGIGLEFSLARLTELRRIALGGTALQMILCGIGGTVFLRLLGFEWIEGVWFGAALSLSSTMVALKTLDAQGQRDTLPGRIMLAMLVVQDLAIIPLMLLLPEVGNLSQGLASVARMAVLGSTMVAVVWLLGRKLLPRLFELVASHAPRELFTLLVVAVGLGVGFVSHRAGLSFAFGAFIAGMVLAESDYSHHVLSELGPLRDLFGMLFFVSVGLLIQPRIVAENWVLVLVLLLGTFAIKSLVFGGVTRWFGYRNLVPYAVGLTLWQIGEFSFVLAQVGVKSGAVSSELYNLVMVTAVLSMVATPFTAGQAGKLRRYLKSVADSPAETEPPRAALSGHVLLGGYGRVGYVLARALAAAGVPLCAVDPRPDAVRKARQDGHEAILGDMTSEVILEASGAFRARMAVLTIPDPISSVRVAEILRRARPDMPILARGMSHENCQDLLRHGVNMALWPEFECGLEMTRHGLMTLDLPADEDTLRQELASAPQELRQVAGVARIPDPVEVNPVRTVVREETREQVVAALIQLGWADGRWSVPEEATVKEILAELGYSPADFERFKQRYRDDANVAELRALDRPARLKVMKLLLKVAHCDLSVPDTELTYLVKMATLLGLSEDELHSLLEQSS